jgi:RND family efflux transporter MFP subunit
MESAQGAYQGALNQLTVTKALLAHDQALFDYSRITAPFDGVVTQRFANLGALMQSGTSSTQATPLVRLSQETLFRLVIPVPESYVRYVHVGENVEVRVPSLGRSFQGKVTRFSVDVTNTTRTMHTEVDVPNTANRLIPGLYAEAVLSLNDKGSTLAVPIQAVDHKQNGSSVLFVDAGNKIEIRLIAVGLQTANYVEAMDGVREGDQVVVSDRSGLKVGQLVKPQLVSPMVYQAGSQEDSTQQ